MTTNYQLMLDFMDGKHTLWQVKKKTDVTCRQLADRHYSRQTVGATSFCRPGKNYVLRTAAGDAVWVGWYSKFRDDCFTAIECTLFRNESEHLSSDLIILASLMTFEHFKKDNAPMTLLTYVDQKSVKSSNTGYCYLKAGYKKLEHKSSKGLLAFTVTYDDLLEKVRELVSKERWYQDLSGRLERIQWQQQMMNEAFSEYEFDMAADYANMAYQEFHSLFNSVSTIFDMSFEHAAHFVKSMVKTRYESNVNIEDLYITLTEWNGLEWTHELQSVIEKVEQLLTNCNFTIEGFRMEESKSLHYLNWIEQENQRFL
ncbi:hypothetical protein A9986_13340 [Solibacillus silvestris]|nr:hypothetical protein [Solibacillus silvestris]OBW54611.1 hypothetical protein A9986_13340 [Solibacillus silvestris]